MKVFIITYFPSPYQVELFNEISKVKKLELKVGYLVKINPSRFWKKREIQHNYWFLEDEDKNDILNLISDSEYIIFNYYRHPIAKLALQFCVDYRKRWCFWGERPGYNQLGLLGALYRYIRLHSLHRSKVPIWGIGSWAVDRYRQEFGPSRNYVNIPYFSDLSRFAYSRDFGSITGLNRVFLYSGSLIYRKGVDLLAEAFRELANKYSFVRLNFLGEGALNNRLKDILSDCQDRVVFLGFQDWSSLPNFYRQADFLCVPSRYDGWGLVVPEGLASGLPVIGTNRTGSALDLIQEGSNGWLIPSHSAEALYKAMEEAALLNQEDLKKYSLNAQRSVSEHQLSNGVQKFCQAIKAMDSRVPPFAK